MNQNLRQSSEYVTGGMFLWFMLSSFVTQRFYSASAPYGTLVFFCALLCLFFLNIPLKTLREDREAGLELLLMAAADLAALLNLFLIGSNKGAFLIVADLTLLLFLSGRIALSARLRRFLTFSGCALMIPWYAYVKWYYGFNMVALAFLIFLMMGEIFLEYVKNDRLFPSGYLKYVQGLFFVTSILLAVCYHARSAVLTMIFFGVVFLILPTVRERKWLYGLLVFFCTLGSLCFTAFYTLLGASGLELQILYKDVLSGREEIWKELWEAFFRHPLTGIGSSYQLKSFFIFEVHNGLFDILAVHGLPVFLLVLFLLAKRLLKMGNIRYEWYPDRRIAAAGVFALLFASFFENCFIVTPYSVVFFILLLLTEEEPG